MRISSIVASLLVSVALVRADTQTTQPGGTAGTDPIKPAPVPAPTAYQVVKSTSNSRVWQRLEYERTPDGTVVSRPHSFTELASGICRQNAAGEWVESREVVEPFANGAVSAQGAYQVVFANNLNSSGSIDLRTPDGKRLQSNILGLRYYDRSTGQGVLIAQLQDSQGEIVGRNQVLYPNAFQGVSAGVRYTYRRGSFEQDVILNEPEQLPTPESVGLNPDSTELQVMTEFLSPPEESITTQENPAEGENDQTISWGAMVIGHGKAFEMGASGAAVPVSKEYITVDGRKILLEKIPVSRIQAASQSLPQHSGTRSSFPKMADSRPALPARPAARSDGKPMRVAKARPADQGFVLDYVTLDASETNYVFQGDTTYLLNGDLNLVGATVLEGGACIKINTNNSCSINVLGTLDCRTGPYRPAVFTTADDGSIGDDVSYSTASCTGTLGLHIANDWGEDLQVWVSDDYGNYYVNGDTVYSGSSSDYSFEAGLGQHYYFDSLDADYDEFTLDFWPMDNSDTIEVDGYGNVNYSESGSTLCTPAAAAPSVALSLANGGTVHDVRICHAGIGIASLSDDTVYNAQFVDCGVATKTENASLFAGNVLLSGVGTAFLGQNFHVAGQNVTFDQGTNVTDDPVGTDTNSTVALTNSLITGVANWGVVHAITNLVERFSSGSGIYQAVGAGNYYLATNSVYRGVGSTNIQPWLLAMFRAKTTYPPLVFSNVTFHTATNFSPRTPRDTNVYPDLGYHYEPLDYVFGQVNLTNDLSFSAGTAVGWFDSGGWGMAANPGVHISFNGTATEPCVFAHYSTAQEGGLISWVGYSWVYFGVAAMPTETDPNYSALISPTFTRLYSLAGKHVFFRDYEAVLRVWASDCEFYNATEGGYGMGLCMTNCLFDRMYMAAQAACCAKIDWRNCTMHGGNLLITHWGSWPVAITNCAFEGVNYSADSSYMTCGYNAYVTNGPTLPVTHTNDVYVTNFNWQTGWFGNYYLPPNSPLINAGSMTADQLGLYHFTTQTNQAPETNSTVDIGYHYVATDASGVPLDSNGDGNPDYLEDVNGDGLADNGETNWALAILTQPVGKNALAGSVDELHVFADGIGPISYQWLFNGTNLPAPIFQPGPTYRYYIMAYVETNSAGIYSVIVSNWSGTITSAPAALTVCTPTLAAISNVVTTAGTGTNTITLTGISAGCAPFTISDFTASSSNPTVVSNFNISYNGTGSTATLTFIPSVTTTGTVTVTASFLASDPSKFNGNYGFHSDIYYQHDWGVYITNLLQYGTAYESFNGGSGTFADTNYFNPSDFLPIIVNPLTNIPPGVPRPDLFCFTNNGNVFTFDCEDLFYEATPPDSSGYSVSYYEIYGMGHIRGFADTPGWYGLGSLFNIYFDYGPSIGFGGDCTFGNSAKTTQTFQITVLPPTNSLSVQILSPTNQIIQQRASVLITASATNSSPAYPVHLVEFFSGTNYLGYAVSTNGNYQISAPFPVPGTNILTAMAVNTNGITAWSPSVTNTVRALPIVTIQAPANGASFAQTPTNIAIRAMATPSMASVTNVTFYQGTNILGVATNGVANLFSITNAFSEGTYLLRAKAYDTLGGVSFSTNITINVETNQPPYVYAGPNETNNLSTNAVPIYGAASDDGLPSNLLSVQWINLDGGTNVAFSVTNAVDTAVTFYATGVFRLQLSAFDGAITSYSVCTQTVSPANLPPNVTVQANMTFVLPALLNTNEPVPVAHLFTVFTNNYLGGGIDYFEPSNCAIIPLFDPNNLNNTYLYLLDNYGLTNLFIVVSNAAIGWNYQASEDYLAAARDTMGGFQPGDVFFGNKQSDCEIVRISPQGTNYGHLGVYSNAWVILPTPGDVIASLWVDDTGVWGGDLLVLAQSGNVWRVNSAGAATLVATTTGTDLEGIVSIPNDPQHYGPWAGEILVGGDYAPINAVDTNGNVQTYDFGFGSENIHAVLPNENMLCLADNEPYIWGASAVDLQRCVGDVVLVDEVIGDSTSDKYLYRAHWNGTNFDISQLNDVPEEWAQINFTPQPFAGTATNFAPLNGFVTDDGHLLPAPTNAWTRVSGPGTATISDPTKTNTFVLFSEPGTNYFRLSSGDGQFVTNVDTMINVVRNQAPFVSAGTNQTISATNTTLTGTVSDDGYPGHQTNILWTLVSNPPGGGCSFGSQNQAVTPVIFTGNVAGAYEFCLTADDTWSTNSSYVIVNVQCPSLTILPAYGPPTLTNTSYTVSTKLLDATGNAMVGSNIVFIISRRNGPGFTSWTQSALTDAHGNASLTYSNVYPGQDYIQASNLESGVVSATVTKDWALELECNAALLHEQDDSGAYSCLASEWPSNLSYYADDYLLEGSANVPMQIQYTTTYGHFSAVLLLKDASNNIVGIANRGMLNYTPQADGGYLLEVVEAESWARLSTGYIPKYNISLSCGNAHASDGLQILLCGTNIVNPQNLTSSFYDGPVVFGNTPPSTSTSITLTITNAGVTTFTLNSIYSYTPFSLNNAADGTVMAPGSSTNLSVSFDPGSGGVKYGNVSVNLDDGATHNVGLIGSGVTGAITPPVVQVIHPPANYLQFYLSESGDDVFSLPFVAFATNGSSALSEVDWYINENSTPTTSPTSYFTNSVGISSGISLDYNVTAVAIDSDGGFAASPEISVHLGDTPPVMDVLYNGTNVPAGQTIFLPDTCTNVSEALSLTISNAGLISIYIYSDQTNSAFVDGEFSLSNDVSGSILLPGETTNLTVTFNAISNGLAVGQVALIGPGLGTSGNNYFFNVEAFAYPTGNVPSLSISSPSPGQVFFAPADVSLTAMATNGTSSISYVDFQETGTNGLIDLGDGAFIGGNAYTIMASGLSAGDFSFRAVAVDSQGRRATSQQVAIHVLPSDGDGHPVARNDVFTVAANSFNNVLNVLSNDYDPEGYPLTIVSVSRPGNNGTATIAPGGKAIVYTPPKGKKSYDPAEGIFYAGDGFDYTISGHGGTAHGSVLVNLFAPASPTVAIVAPTTTGSSPYPTNAGSVVPIVAQISPSQYITNVQFYVGDVLIGSVTNGSGGLYTNLWTASAKDCQCGFYAIAYDSFGQIGSSAPIYITVTPPPNGPGGTNSIGPIAAFGNYYAGTNGAQPFTNFTTIRDGIINLTGQAFHPLGSNDVVWSLGVYTYDGQTLLRDLTPKPLVDGDYTSGHVGTNGINGILTSNCDLTTLANGSYIMRLTVQGGLMITNTDVVFLLDSNLKIGQFSFSQQDLVIPVNGIPLTVTRTYNSLNPDKGDFGYSWTYSLADMDVQVDEDRRDISVGGNTLNFDTAGLDSGDQAQNISVRSGGNRDVTLTLPDGTRTSFAYSLVQGGGDAAGTTYNAIWNAPPGVNAKLYTPNASTGGGDIGDNTVIAPLRSDIPWYWAKGPDGSTYETYDIPEWILEMPDGTKYHITRGSADIVTYEDPSGSGHFTSASVCGLPKLSTISQKNTDTISISQSGIVFTATNGATNQIVFQRNVDGLITSISDPGGLSGGTPSGPPAVKYEYDGYGNLVYVERLLDRNAGTYATNSFLYQNPNFPHFITSMFNGDGTQVAENFYDDSGKLIAVQDANGTKTLFTHSLTNSTEIVVDRSGNTNTYVYDTRGNVTAETDPLGNTTYSSYDANNNLLSTVDPLLNTNSYGYDANNNHIQSVDPMGRTNSFAYDSNDNLISQTDPLGNSTTNTYDANGNLVSTTNYDAAGNPITSSTSTYNGGLLTQTADALGRTTASFAYDPSTGYLTGTTDANNFTRNFAYDANGNQTNTSYSWTGPGGSTTVTTTTIYDAQNRVTMTVDADGNTNQIFYNINGKVAYTLDKYGNTNSFIYDARGNVIQQNSADGTFTCTVYDSAGRPYLTSDRNQLTGTLMQYDPLGRATNTIRMMGVVINIAPDPQNPSVMTSTVGSFGTGFSTNSTVYMANGWVASRTGPDGQTTTYTYWPDGQAKTVVDALNHTNYSQYDNAGRQALTRDALNHTVQFQYDGVGRLVTTIFNDNSTTTNLYNSLGQRTGQVDQAARVTQFAYDVSGELTNVVKPPVPDPLNGFTATNASWSYTYDQYERQTVTTDPLGHTNAMAYDAQGRQLTKHLPLGQIGTNVYATSATTNHLKGQLWRQYDYKGQCVEYQYDHLGRVKAKYFFAANATAPSNSVTYLYDSLGRVTETIENVGTNASQGYAFLGGVNHGVSQRLWACAVSHPEAAGEASGFAMLGMAFAVLPVALRRRFLGFAMMVYHEQCELFAPLCGGGIRLRRRTPRLRLPSYGWRFATLITMAAMIANEPGIDQFWNARAGGFSYPSNASNAVTRYTYYSYDFDGHLIQINTPEGVINYAYDLATGRLIETNTKNTDVQYTYDALGQLYQVEAVKRNGVTLSTPEVTTYNYDKVGNRSSVQLPNGITSTYKYDSLNRLTNLVHQIGTTTVTNLASYSYQLDQTGRRTNAVEILQQEGGTFQTNTLAWGYDAMYRLTNEVSVSKSLAGGTYAYTNNYVYDLAGNRMQQLRTGSTLTVTTNAYDANDELLREVTKINGALNDTNSYAYDLNGSVTGKTNGTGTVTYAYDVKNKLSGVLSAGILQASYLYNNEGVRVSQTANGGNTTHYLVDAANLTGYAQVLEELANLNTTPTTSYIIGADVLAQCGTTSTAPSYFLLDGHGNNRQLSSIAGTVSSHFGYEAYGTVQTNMSTYSAETAVNSGVTSKLYCGEQYDSNLHMYNLRARYYNPANGTFNQRDTFAGNNFDPQSLHKYTYCHGDPSNRIDPSGRFTLSELVVVTGVIAVLGALLLPAIMKAKQRAQFKSLEAYHKTPLQFQFESGQINKQAFYALSPDEQQSQLDYLNKMGEQQRQIELAKSGDDILAANGAEALLAANDVGSLGLGFGSIIAVEGIAGKTIGLGLEEDLLNLRGTGAIIYKNSGWQQAGLTRVDFGKASMDDYWFRASFKEASQNADAIRFDVSSFVVGHPKSDITAWELGQVVENPSLLGKTTFIRNNEQVIWNGTGFEKP